MGISRLSKGEKIYFSSGLMRLTHKPHNVSNEWHTVSFWSSQTICALLQFKTVIMKIMLSHQYQTITRRRQWWCRWWWWWKHQRSNDGRERESNLSEKLCLFTWRLAFDSIYTKRCTLSQLLIHVVMSTRYRCTFYSLFFILSSFSVSMNAAETWRRQDISNRTNV